MRIAAVTLGLVLTCAMVPAAVQDRPPAATPNTPLDEILDVYVRDGLVYYRALRQERRRLDAYVTSLAETAIDSSSREERLAFWLNAYNALVLKTVIDHYPIPRQSKDTPTSIRIPGAFERLQHRVGRRRSRSINRADHPGAFRDPRVYLAIGRGAMGAAVAERIVHARTDRDPSQVAAEA
jgi:hypothetical protein